VLTTALRFKGRKICRSIDTETRVRRIMTCVNEEKWHTYVLWRIDPFLGNDRETNKTTAVAKQLILNK
jgi:hypothetical protein